LALTAAIVLLGCAYYSVRLSPDTVFFVTLTRLKDAWAEKMATEHGSKIVVCGGSSALFSIDGERLLKQDRLPVVNKGMNAGFGAQVLVLYGYEGLQTGDTLVVAMEPPLMTEPLLAPAQGVRFSVATRHLGWVLAPDLEGTPRGALSALCCLRPGADHVFPLFGKILGRQPLFRYSLADAHGNASGWIQTDSRFPLAGAPMHGPELPSDVRRFLRALRDRCDARRIRVVYSLPWAYAPEDKLAAFRQENARFLLQVMEFLPVLKDPRLGGSSAAEDFSDTGWHLTNVASARRTTEFGESLKSWRVWTTEELRQVLQNPETAEGR
jgi:hypothetical protein